MFIRVLDAALNVNFFTAGVLYRLRHRMEPTTEDEDRLMLAWIEAGRKKSILMSELDHASFTRLNDDQIELVCAAKSAQDKCYNLLVRLRARKKAQRKVKVK